MADKAQQLQQIIDSVAAGGILSRVDQNQEIAWAEFESRRVRVVEFWEKTPRGWTLYYFVGEVMLDGEFRRISMMKESLIVLGRFLYLALYP